MHKITISEKSITYYQYNPSYIKFQQKNQIFLRCIKEEAQGIISKDGSEIYLFTEVSGVAGYAFCRIEEVPESEYIEHVEKKGQETSDAVSAMAEGIRTVTGGTGL